MSRGRKPFVVDTNVLITANRRQGESYTCAAECARALVSVRREGKLLTDNAGLFFAEYKRYLNFKGQPGLGDAFFKWLLDHRGRVDLCQEVPISSIEHHWRLFSEFPDDVALQGFDPADQKWIAVAKASETACEVLQATDHKWIAWREALGRNGVQVQFLCETELRAVAERKTGS